MKYPLFYKNTTVGEVEVSQKGLYYQFDCRCNPPDRNFYRIVISIGNTEQSLGICIPDGKHFVLSKQLSVKSIKEGEWEFYLRPKDAVDSVVVAVSDDEPFPQLDKLLTSSLVVRNDEPFITIREEV